ncbi:hypothetical protein LTR78_007248 [Recurvomyces mirabilis]|uniref:Uncharacterized protein n=1 Tax=Recurvomyces mirabilis TaxID=574656 RepID=A0AAE0WJK5_9PEZI|nr:hypothetical protein LTR78_007248 [Recurvomyces mirabilis]KAK5155509.1 hypothetical protein LTS14_005770 [Recurvomyces mirabilis]
MVPLCIVVIGVVDNAFRDEDELLDPVNKGKVRPDVDAVTPTVPTLGKQATVPIVVYA